MESKTKKKDMQEMTKRQQGKWGRNARIDSQTHMKFPINFKDIEASIRQFSGKDSRIQLKDG